MEGEPEDIYQVTKSVALTKILLQEFFPTTEYFFFASMYYVHT